MIFSKKIDGSGRISSKELGAVMQEAGQKKTEDELEDLVRNSLSSETV